MNDVKEPDKNNELKGLRSPADYSLLIPALLAIGFIATLLLIFRDGADVYLSDTMTFLTHNFAFLYEFSTFGISITAIYLCFSAYGRIRLGDKEPEFKTITWIGLMFTAAVGSSLMYWGFLEPMHYMLTPPFAIEPKSVRAQEWALPYVMFHWGLNGWPIFCLPGIAIGYAYHVRNFESIRLSSACRGFLGDRVDGLLGKVIDIAIIWGMVGGLGTSLGLGVSMVSRLVCDMFGFSPSLMVDAGVIIAWTIMFSTSALPGLYKGIKVLSDINVYLAIALTIFVALVGPTAFILANFTNGLGLMLNNLIFMNLYTDPIAKSGFPQNWTVFYWAWWFANAAFMAMFIARVSRGRTIRQIILCQCIFSSLGCWMWFAVFSNYAINLQVTKSLDVLGILERSGGPEAIVAILKTIPLSIVVIPVFTALAFIFLATTLNSATYVMAHITSRNYSKDAEPARWNIVLWGAILGGMTLILLMVSGSKALRVVQTSAVFVSIPVVFIIIMMTLSMMKWAREDFKDELMGKPLKKSHEKSKLKKT